MKTEPKCKLFRCSKRRGCPCCFYCDRATQCVDPCLNHPEKCGQLVNPEQIEVKR